MKNMYLLGIEKGDNVDVYRDSEDSEEELYNNIYSGIFLLINDVLFLLPISIKINGNIYTKPVTNVYLLNHKCNINR